MRLKEESDNWRASALKARDFRHTKAGPETVAGPKKTHKRDTRTWCKGKVGRSHTVKLRTNSYSTFTTAYCTSCGMDEYRLPDNAVAQVRPHVAQQLALAAKWCTEGHLYDNVTISFRSEIMNGTVATPVTRTVTRTACVMCGKRQR